MCCGASAQCLAHGGVQEMLAARVMARSMKIAQLLQPKPQVPLASHPATSLPPGCQDLGEALGAGQMLGLRPAAGPLTPMEGLLSTAPGHTRPTGGAIYSRA